MKRRKILVGLLSVSVVALWTAPMRASESSVAGEEVIDSMIAAHGGLEAWRTKPTVSFTDWFGRPGSEATPSRVSVEQSRRRAYIDFPGTEMRLAWDGDQAWSENWQAPYPPRFLALLNYYFLNLPWMARDPGVVLAEPGTAMLWDDPKEYLTVRMTFDAGVGDTPDDYYVLYVDSESHRLKATEYAVTYQALLPEGVEAGNPHILVYDEWIEVDGLLVPARYTIYELDQKVFGTCKIEDWSFTEPFDEARMTMPEGAVVDESTP